MIFIYDMKLQPYIYRKQIKSTGKYYIGKHNGNNINYKGSGIEWKQDLKKYVKNFKTDLIEEILEYVDDLSKLNEREEYWLEYYDVVNNPLYYNKTNKSYGVYKTEEYTKVKQSLSSPKRKKIIQYDLNGKFIKIWECMNDASKYLKIKTGDLTCACQGKQKTAKNYQWRYYIENYSSYLPPIINHRSDEFKKQQSIRLTGKSSPRKGKYKFQPIIKYNKKGEIINTFDNPMEATNFNREKAKNIISCLKGKQKTAFGYIWKYR